MNVYEEEKHPFLKDEDVFIKKVLSGGVPCFGVCLGSQLIAKALGGRVYKNAVKEIGWYEVRFTEAARNDRLFAGLEDTELVFHWHGETFSSIGKAHSLPTMM